MRVVLAATALRSVRVLWKAFLDAGTLLGLWGLLVLADALQRAAVTPTWVALP